MMKRKHVLIAAGLIAGAAALTGCTAQTTPVVTPTPDTAAKTTAQPVTAAPDAQTATPQPSESAAGEDTPGAIALRVNGELLKVHALEEEGEILLPLIETAKVLGWSAKEDTVEEEEQTRRSVELTKEDSQISVAWVVSDNTAQRITWQKDGLLIPVDPKITTFDGAVYVPAAFFEEAASAAVSRTADGADVADKAPNNTPDTKEQTE